MSQESEPQDAEEKVEEENSEDNYETVLYAFPREATTEEDIQAIMDALPDEYVVRASEGAGDNMMVQREKEAGSTLDMSSLLSE